MSEFRIVESVDGFLVTWCNMVVAFCDSEVVGINGNNLEYNHDQLPELESIVNDLLAKHVNGDIKFNFTIITQPVGYRIGLSFTEGDRVAARWDNDMENIFNLEQLEA